MNTMGSDISDGKILMWEIIDWSVCVNDFWCPCWELDWIFWPNFAGPDMEEGKLSWKVMWNCQCNGMKFGKVATGIVLYFT